MYESHLYEMAVGVENGYDEVNIQIPAKYKYVFSQQIMLGQENVATYVHEIKLRSCFMFPVTLSHQSNFTVKTAESFFFIERSRNKRFESEDGPKGPKA
ncbi:hypothetical protein F2Q68_00014357 [Brassica cretica]|uniref:Uncharacterized protein n=1 Tax=Brassica cretica TaxID=69181 RepID=A0A8S9H820_BRACR|nr:hypothetical protein F2Q68_00014357 [Brassica cretica]